MNQQTTPELLMKAADNLFSQFTLNPEDDPAYFSAIIDEFGEKMDVMNQLKQFHAWCIDQHPTKISNCRFRFRSWLVNAKNYSESRSVNGSPYPHRNKKSQKNCQEE
jgi:hypothetical protein